MMQLSGGNVFRHHRLRVSAGNGRYRGGDELHRADVRKWLAHELVRYRAALLAFPTVADVPFVTGPDRTA